MNCIDKTRAEEALKKEQILYNAVFFMKSKKEKILTSVLWASRFTTWISFEISVLI